MKNGLLAVAMVGVAAVMVYLAFDHTRPKPEGTAAESLAGAETTNHDRTSRSRTDGRTDAASGLAAVAPAAGAVEAAPAGVAVSTLPESTALTATPEQEQNRELPAATVLENVRTLFRQYHSMLGENPVGTNEEITKALQGENPKQANFLTAPEYRVSAKGELLDPWGTPYFFHQLSAEETEIRSAGPDRKMWTADDLVIK